MIRRIASLMLTASLVLLCAPLVAAQMANESPVTLTISGPETVTVGQQIVIQPKLRNVSSDKILVWFGRRYTVRVQDENGKEPHRKDGIWVWAGSSAQGNIEPGEDVGDFLAGLNGYDLVPGKYVVSLERPLDDSPKSPILRSNEIVIAVVPAAKEKKQ